MEHIQKTCYVSMYTNVYCGPMTLKIRIKWEVLVKVGHINFEQNVRNTVECMKKIPFWVKCRLGFISLNMPEILNFSVRIGESLSY
jgi:hypothetical protein